MVLPAKTEDLVKRIIQYGFLKDQGWKKELKNVSECSKEDISACIEHFLSSKHHCRFNGSFVLGLCRIYENNVKIILKLAYRLQARDKELQEVMISAIVPPPLDFDAPELTVMEAEEILSRGVRFQADISQITIKEVACTNLTEEPFSRCKKTWRLFMIF